MKSVNQSVATAAALLVASPALAGGLEVLDLSGLCHGHIASGQTIGGVTIGADNFHNDLDLAVVFDTGARRTADRDLQNAVTSGSWRHRRGDWKTGNLRGTDVEVGSILIIQEQNRNTRIINKGAAVNTPDDEGRRRGGDQAGAGELYFSFERPVTAVGFDLIDVEGTAEFQNGTGFFATFSDLSTTVSVAFKDLVDSASAFYDSSIRFGDSSANRVQPITAEQLGLTSISNFTINLGGSGGVGNIVTSPVMSVPTPSAAAAGLGVLALLGRRRRKG